MAGPNDAEARSHVTESIPSPPGDSPAQPFAPLPTPGFEARFQSLSELARGGQGRVMIARDSVLHREVALKELLRSGSAGAQRRFEREALLTARLQHPGIVSIYELGRRNTGEAVLVMRRVQGKPFDQALAEAGSYEKRLAYLAPLTAACDAIAYAHKQGVIHRDIKPANILLGDFGDTVVIDWGIAKEIGKSGPDDDAPGSAGSGPENPDLTSAGEVVGTPSFMSPEQARGEPASTRSDVYALGAMLYQLISGRPPYQGKTSLEVLEQVRRGPPASLSSLVPEVAPELESMVMRAMAQDAAARYATAAELAEELKQFQAGRLIKAHSYSTLELIKRWARRNALLLSVIGISLVVLAAGAVISVRRIVAERTRANREAATSRRVSDFMTAMFKVSDPGVARGNSVTAREILDKAAKDIQGGLADEPEMRARLMRSMGSVYSNLGLFPQAGALLEQALPVLQRTLGPDDPESIQAELDMIALLGRLRRIDEAEKLAVDVIERARRVLGPGSRAAISAMTKLGLVYKMQKKLPQAEKQVRETLEISRKSLGDDSDLTLNLLNNLSVLDDMEGHDDESIQVLRESIAIRMRKFGPEDQETLGALSNLGVTLCGMRRPEAPKIPARLAEAEQIYLKILPIQQRTLGPDHPDTLDSLANLAAVYDMQKRYAESETLVRERLAGVIKRYGPDHPLTQEVRADLVNELTSQGKAAEVAQVKQDMSDSAARSAVKK